MAEADGADSDTLCDKHIGERVEKELQKPSEREAGDEEAPGQSSQVYTATSLSLNPDTENRVITHPLVIFTLRTRQIQTFIHLQYPLRLTVYLQVRLEIIIRNNNVFLDSKMGLWDQQASPRLQPFGRRQTCHPVRLFSCSCHIRSHV